MTPDLGRAEHLMTACGYHVHFLTETIDLPFSGIKASMRFAMARPG
jgi:hypothetical protein